jgi:hypothetical protein
VNDATVGTFSLREGSIGTHVEDVQAFLNTLRSDVNSNDVELADHETRISDNELQLIDHETRIGTNETNIGTNTTNIGTNATDIQAIEDSVGAANGIAPLGGDSKVPAINLPSYVDDVEEYADLASFPVTGETGKIYVAIDTGKTYRWSGSIYVEISASDVNSVNGQVGIVTITKSDVGLANVTDDAQLKRVSGDINTFTEKLLSVEDDILLLEDSEDSFNKKKIKISSILATNDLSVDGSQSVNFTAENKKLYPISSGLDVQLPLPSASFYCVIKDITGDVDNNPINIVRNGVENIDGVASDFSITSNYQSINIISDGTDWFIY